MKKAILFLVITFFYRIGLASPDTVKVGAYVMSVHDINFHDQEYTARLWLWFLSKNKNFDFGKQLDITNAKSIDPMQVFEDSLEEKHRSMLKVKCTMKENWNVLDFPFDKQHLKIQVENSLFDKKQLVFMPDLAGSKFDKNETLAGWTIKDFTVDVVDSFYETGFGDDRKEYTNQVFSAFIIEMDIDRNAWGLFLKIFIGMYISFLISMVGFALQPQEFEPRFGLPVGGLFAAVGNKYIIDSILPESTAFTLVDTLHAITFFAILTILVVSAISLKMHTQGKEERAVKFSYWGAQMITLVYVMVNIVLVVLAIAE